MKYCLLSLLRGARTSHLQGGSMHVRRIGDAQRLLPPPTSGGLLGEAPGVAAASLQPSDMIGFWGPTGSDTLHAGIRTDDVEK